MSTNSLLLPEFALQCCDAASYLTVGTTCADGGDCYGDLRPGGVYYWFSLPARLGLPNEIMVALNFFLLLLSALLSAQTLLLVARRIANSHFNLGTVQKVLLALICIAVHAVFLWPVIFTTLSDAPAALFLLIGIWGLLLSSLISGTKQLLLITVASLSLGGAAWIRAFYLYPVIICVVVCLIASLPNFRRKLCNVLVLFALVLPGFQFYNTYTHTGKWTYFPGGETNNWIGVHLNSYMTGYDTILPNGSQFWRSQYCNVTLGILPALQQHNYSALACLLANRAAFYTATYNSANYAYPSVKNRLLSNSIENIGDDKLWLRYNLERQADVAAAPNSTMTADTLTPQPDHADKGAYVAQWVALPANTDHTFSVWLWSDKPNVIELALRRHIDNRLIASTVVNVTSQPTRFSVTGKTVSNADYEVIIGIQPFFPDAKTIAGSQPLPSPFYAWGTQLEEGDLMTEYAGIDEIVDAGSIRQWHLWLLVANSLAMLVALLFIVRTRSILLFEPIGLAVIVTVGTVFAGALIIIPEQRFAIVFMVFMWLLASAQIFFWLSNIFRSKTPYSPAP